VVKVEAQILPDVRDVVEAGTLLKDVVLKTPLMENLNLSDAYEANIQLKREDLQVVRSYKIRGAFNKMASLTAEQRKHGVVCASAGNHGQGVAYACQKLGIKGIIFMPTTTPGQKVGQVRSYGKDKVEIILTGDTFDDAFEEAKKYCETNDAAFIHPFNDREVIAGQGTVGLEILADASGPIDYLILPIGGGGLASGVSTYFKILSPKTKIIGVEPAGAAAMKASVEANELVTLEHIDKFVDGAAVKRVGELTLAICQENLDDIITVPEGKICSTILKLYNQEDCCRTSWSLKYYSP
jgi:threonine dehydratase